MKVAGCGEGDPHRRSKANSALTSAAPFDCTHGGAAPRADIEVTVQGESLYRMDSAGAVQPGAAICRSVAVDAAIGWSSPA